MVDAVQLKSQDIASLTAANREAAKPENGTNLTRALKSQKSDTSQLSQLVENAKLLGNAMTNRGGSINVSG